MGLSTLFAAIILLFIIAKILAQESNQRVLQGSIESTLMKYFDVKDDEVNFIVKSVRYDFEKQIAAFDLEVILHLENILKAEEMKIPDKKGQPPGSNKPRKGRGANHARTEVIAEEPNKPTSHKYMINDRGNFILTFSPEDLRRLDDKR